MEKPMTVHISRENIITHLLTTPMFEGLEPAEIGDITHIVDIQKFNPGEIIFREGEAGDAWYTLYKGEVEVLKQTESGEKSIKALGPHSCFGEIAVLDGLPRSATIRTSMDSVVFRIPMDKFNDLIDSNDLVAYKLIKHMAIMLASRQRTSTETLSKLLHANELANVHEGIREIVGDSTFRE
jgi:CRP-like cAMP-binding protein